MLLAGSWNQECCQETNPSTQTRQAELGYNTCKWELRLQVGHAELGQSTCQHVQNQGLGTGLIGQFWGLLRARAVGGVGWVKL